MPNLLIRQKQYFEQRKRQQQTAGFESYSDGKRPCTPQCDYSRSLDVLSLENFVSTEAQEHNTSTITGNFLNFWDLGNQNLLKFIF